LSIALKFHRNPTGNSAISGSNSAFPFTDNADVYWAEKFPLKHSIQPSLREFTVRVFPECT